MPGDQGSRDPTNGPLINEEPIAPRGHILWSRDRGSRLAIWNSSTVTTELVPSNAKPKPNLRPSRQHREEEVPLQAPCSARGGALWGSVPCRCAGTGDVLGLAWLGLAWLGLADLTRRGRRRRSLLQLGHVTYRDAAPAPGSATASTEDIVARHQRCQRDARADKAVPKAANRQAPSSSVCQEDDARRTDLSGSGRRSKQRDRLGRKIAVRRELAAELGVSGAPAPGIRTSDQQAVRDGIDALGTVMAQRRARSRAILWLDPSSARFNSTRPRSSDSTV